MTPVKHVCLGQKDYTTALSGAVHAAVPSQASWTAWIPARVRLGGVSGPIFRGDEDLAELGDHVGG